MLVLVALPRLEPSAMHVKAAVEQPIFVTPLAAIAKRTASTITAQTIDKVAISKLATALRDQPADQQAVVSPGATRTRMRAHAYPGEDPATVKPPELVGDAIVALLERDFETGERVRVEDPVGA